MTSSLPLLCIPYLPLKKIIDFMEPSSLVSMALCSQKCQSVIKTHRRKSIDGHLHVSGFEHFLLSFDKFCDYQIVMVASGLQKMTNRTRFVDMNGQNVALTVNEEKGYLVTHWEDEVNGVKILTDYVTQLFNIDVLGITFNPHFKSNIASTLDMTYEGRMAFDWMVEKLWMPYQFISQNFVVSGSGRIEIPTFKSPIPPGIEEGCLFAVTVQNHTLDNSFVSMNYTIESTDGSDVFKFPSEDALPLFGTAETSEIKMNGSLLYKWTIDYYYKTDEPQIIQCRMYGQRYQYFFPLP
ncbi:hypothetical protein GCK72_015611 [Caenorhabditis remanei]|uniref:F-box domain-containing protein n=1 Tax=Caenorhabditis remanei TaxID=31234 RepID=A0A6A5GUJ1_CAERE|nr:hypothetical protein GCK72_015611 [Caenorhabditis remanei]KAF1759150.1 hypothetical protein GCK72_015611 [Caenorhabditis remanei]